MREYVDLNINDGRGITKFCRIVCEQVRLRNVERILIVSPWITPRTQSEYNLERMMEVMGRSRSLRDSVLLTVITRPPILGDFMGAGERHAEAILLLSRILAESSQNSTRFFPQLMQNPFRIVQKHRF